MHKSETSRPGLTLQPRSPWRRDSEGGSSGRSEKVPIRGSKGRGAARGTSEEDIGRIIWKRKNSPHQGNGGGHGWSFREIEAKNRRYLERRVQEQLRREKARWEQERRLEKTDSRARKDECLGPMAGDVRGVKNGREV